MEIRALQEHGTNQPKLPGSNKKLTEWLPFLPVSDDIFVFVEVDGAEASQTIEPRMARVAALLAATGGGQGFTAATATATGFG